MTEAPPRDPRYHHTGEVSTGEFQQNTTIQFVAGSASSYKISLCFHMEYGV